MGERVVVIGGGLAGVAAACRLAGDGHRPILLERSPRLGGRAASFQDPSSGEWIDYGHHVSMRCCTATHGFLQRIGASDAIAYQERLSIPILCDGGQTMLRSSWLPGILHLAPALLAYLCLSPRERLGVVRAAAGLLIAGRADVAFGPWLRARGQGTRAIARLWDPICVATLNAHVDDVSIRDVRHVLLDGFLFPEGAGLGLFARPLASLFEAAADYIAARNGTVRMSCGVRRILRDDSRAIGVETAQGEILESSSIIAAVPPWDLDRLIDDDRLKGLLASAQTLSWAPIVNVHLWFDRPILDEDFVIAVDSPLQAVFDVSRIYADPGSSGYHLAISQSAAGAWIGRDPEAVTTELLDELRRLLPAARDASLIRHRVIAHRRATFVPAPGTDALRPGSKTPLDGLFLAGDWAATGWPSTIEGAIRSGIAAAGRVSGELAPDGEAVEPNA